MNTKSKPKLFITRALPNVALDALDQKFDMTINPDDRVLEKSEILEHIADQDALLCLLTDTIDKAVIQAGHKLKVISNYAVGFNNIDVAEATRCHIPVCITPGILTDTTADLTFGLILAVMRRIVESDQYTRQGLFEGWSPTLFLGTDVHKKVLGIVGMGRIGQAVARRAKGFDMKILYTGRTDQHLDFAEYVSLEELLSKSDIVSLHTPLTQETHHLIGEKQFKLMKKTAFLINTTRGAVVDEIALLHALEQKDIAGAGLDVYEHEPKLTPGLSQLKSLVLLPHIGSATVETRSKMAEMAVGNILAIFEGQQPYAIANPEVLKSRYTLRE